MYNSHRGMVPAAPNNRLAELLDQLRAEFETQAGRANEYEQQSMPPPLFFVSPPPNPSVWRPTYYYLTVATADLWIWRRVRRHVPLYRSCQPAS